MSRLSVLVTGGAGFIGSFLVDRLVRDGHRVRILDNFDARVHVHGRPAHLNADAELRVADVRDIDAVRSAVDDIDTIVHCAAAVGVGQSAYEVARYVGTNVEGTANLLQAIIDSKRALKRLIVFASMTGYGEGVYVRPSDGARMRVGIRREEDIVAHGWEPTCPQTKEPLVAHPTDEDAALMATNIYALTKRYQEELALSSGRTFGFPVVCFRLFNVFGPRQSLSNPYTGVLSIFLSRLLKGHPPVVYEDGNQSRDFISVHDVVHEVLLALESPRADGQVVNLGSGSAQRIGAAATTLASILGTPEIGPDVTGQYRKGDVRHCIADIGRARHLLGFEPTVSWQQGLGELIDWARQSPSEDRFEQAQRELVRHGLLSARLDDRNDT